MEMIQANNNFGKVGFDETIKSVSEKISIIPISLHIISTHLNGDETQ